MNHSSLKPKGLGAREARQTAAQIQIVVTRLGAEATDGNRDVAGRGHEDFA
jgi:hypothetical protein